MTSDNPLTFTGERFLPEVRGTIFYEHWHRYAAAASLVAGKQVLDAASGEGYGSHLLAHAAAQVTGVDLSPAAVAHATERYARANLRFVAGSVTALPLPDASVDAVISFETIEHLEGQAEMLAEFRRVLAPDGVLVISSPNRPVYNEAGGEANHYHVRELDRDELAVLLAPGFPQQAWYAQRVIAQSALWAEGGRPGAPAYLRLAADAPVQAAEPAPPMYFLVVAAAASVPLPTLPPLSLFDDGQLSLWSDYSRALTRERTLAWDELAARKIAEDRLAELVPAINALSSEREANAALRARIDGLEAALVEAQAAAAEFARAQAEERSRLEGLLVREQADHADTRRRLAYRESARGWLRYPLAAARQRLAAGR